MSNPTRNLMREGFALPVALLAIMVIGALVTGGFYASSQESRISTGADLEIQAFYVAEYGLNESLGTWRNDVLAPVTTSTTLPSQQVVQGGQVLGEYTMEIRRLGKGMYLVSSEGLVTAGQRQATREVATVVRTAEPQMPFPSALVIYGGLRVGGSSFIDGNDSGGPGCGPGAAVPGVTAHDTDLVEVGNGGGRFTSGHVDGDPPVVENGSLDTISLGQFGGTTLDMLTSMATLTYAAGESEDGLGPVTATDHHGNEYCDKSVKSNWGDPTASGPCADYFPIIHAKGDMHLTTGTGQGILIVDGDLKVTGNHSFYGVIVVRGTFKTTGTGNHMEGTVIAMNGGDLSSESTSLGNSLIQYSRCRVQNALNSVMRPIPLTSRSLTDLTASAAGGGYLSQVAERSRAGGRPHAPVLTPRMAMGNLKRSATTASHE